MTYPSLNVRKRFLRLSAAGLLSFSGLVLSPAPARAEEPAAASSTPSPEAVAEAGQRYDRGLKLYSEGEYRLAVIEFERTYELVPDYRVLYNIGQVRIQLGDYARARVALERYMREGAGQLPPAREEAVKADLEMLEGRTATLKIESGLVGAEVLVDGEAVGVTPLSEPVLMNAGEHSIELRKPGYRARVLRRTLAGNDAGQISIELDEIAEPSVGTGAPARASLPPQPPRSTTPMWIGWIATGTLAAGAAVTGVLGLRAADELDSLNARRDVTKSELNSQENRARMFLVTADALTAAAVVAGGVSLYLTLRSPPAGSEQRDSASLSLGLTPSEVRLIGRY
jgi:tetratricopeptide (TPR) repeat protein